MRDLLLQGAGAIAIVVSLIHGVLGETKIFARATIEPPRLRFLLHLVYQAGTVAWIGGGVLLVAANDAAAAAAERLAESGVACTVWDPRVVKPLDPDMLADAAGREASRAHAASLLRDHHMALPDADTNHLRMDLGAFRMRWELHTEFVT